MKLFLAAFAALLAAALPARAQVVTTYGTALGQECFRYAYFGGDAGKGVGICTLALERDLMTSNDRAATLDNRGVLLDRLNRLDEAEADFTQALTLRPDLGDAYVNRGAVLIKRKQFAEALVQVERGIALGNSYPHIAEYDRAVALQLMGRVREAYDGYRKALALEPGFVQAAEQLKNFTVTRTPATN